MTIAQCKAARRKAKSFLKNGPIGQTRYHVRSADKLAKRDQQVVAKQRQMQSRKGAKK